MPPPEIRKLTLPLHSRLLEDFEDWMIDESAKIKKPVTLEAYLAGVLVNYWVNRKSQEIAQIKQREMQGELKKMAEEAINATLKELNLAQ